MKPASTYLGSVIAVTGSNLKIQLSPTVSSGLAIINGATYRIGQVGSFVRIPQGYNDLYGIVCEVDETPNDSHSSQSDRARRSITAELVGEAVGASFERGISQYPSVGDGVHLVTESDLKKIYGTGQHGHVEVGRLASAENIGVKVDIEKLVTRHSAILGSTGSGKSTTVASLLRSLVTKDEQGHSYPSARILLMDIHGEYALALSDVASVFRIDPNQEEQRLAIPYWALDVEELVPFLFGGLDELKAQTIFDKVTELKTERAQREAISGVDLNSITVDTPIPFSLKRLWYELIEVELMTFHDTALSKPAKEADGDVNDLKEPKYTPHSLGSAGPYLNRNAPGIKRQLRNLRSKLLDRQYDFLLHPAEWEPNSDGVADKDLPELLRMWLGHSKPITILDLSGVPSLVLIRLIGSILKIVFTALFWSREKSEGGIDRPLLVVMEEAHRYLHGDKSRAKDMVQQIVKEGRKYGVGAMIVSQRPSEVDETVLSQCGTFFGLRLSNPTDRAHVKGTLPDSLSGLMDMLPVLRTGEAIITGEAATLPIRCRINLPDKKPNSVDPEVAVEWAAERRDESTMDEIYNQIAASWRSQLPSRPFNPDIRPDRHPVKDSP